MAQAVIQFLKNQYTERDGIEQRFFAGCFGIFGHGNVAGIGQALHQSTDFRYYQTRNEQAMVHTAVAYAKHKNRLQSLVCTTSIGPGAMASWSRRYRRGCKTYRGRNRRLFCFSIWTRS